MQATMRAPRRKLGAPFEERFEDQQLVLDEDGFGHHGTRARPGEPGDCRQEVKNQNRLVAHGTIGHSLAKSQKC